MISLKHSWSQNVSYTNPVCTAAIMTLTYLPWAITSTVPQPHKMKAAKHMSKYRQVRVNI